MSVVVHNLNNDQIEISESYTATRIDRLSDAKVSSPDGIINVHVAMWADEMWTADPVIDRLGIDSSSGITLSNGLNVGSIVNIDGTIGTIAPGSSGLFNFHIMFDEDALAPASAIEKLIHALTYMTTGYISEFHFARKILVAVSPDTGDSSENWITITNETGSGGGGGGGGGGTNLAPTIGGNLSPGTIVDMATPFSQVTISDVNNDALTVTVSLNDASKGEFLATSLSGGNYDAASGTYTIKGSPAEVQNAVQRLVFIPKASDNALAWVAPMIFKIVASDPYASTAATVDATVLFNRPDILRGGSGSDKLYGYSGKDRLYGNKGNDKLWGGSSNDILSGGAGKDVFVFDTTPNKKMNLDKITDFKVKDDSIWLDNAVFTKLGKSGTEARPAQLKSGYFTIGSKAKDKNDYIIYDNKKGVLYYDADGSGKGKAVEFATVSKNLEMTHKDFFVI